VSAIQAGDIMAPSSLEPILAWRIARERFSASAISSVEVLALPACAGKRTADPGRMST
jgi:hypothetical protein